MKLLQELFAQGFLSESSLDDLKKQVGKNNRTEEEVILARNIVTEDFLFELKNKISGIPLVKVEAEKIPADILALVPEEASVNYKMAAIGRVSNGKKDLIQIGMVYPENISAQNALMFLANQENFAYQICLITFSNLAKILKQHEKMLLESSTQKNKNHEIPLDKKPLSEIIEEDSAVKLVKHILRMAIEGNASDIHIEPCRDKLNIRYRLNGILHTTLALPFVDHQKNPIAAIIKNRAGLKIDESRLPQDGRFSEKINDKNIDFRVATFPTLYGEKVELRVLDVSTGLKSFEQLGLYGRNLEIIKDVIKKPYGMILLVGPTGSGKTTTQYAILRTLNNTSVNIVTVEDPIEYSIDGVNQSQVKPEIGYTFASGIRQILRQDPNIIMVGEIRDEETADLAVNAALTGHIVLSTLHANSSVGVFPRLIDMGIRPFLIPATLKLVISQRLIRVLCPHCKTKIRPSDKVRNYIIEKVKEMPSAIKNSIKIAEPMFIYSSKGCEACGLTGYLGRIGLYEILSMTNELAELFQKDLLESSILKVAQKQGMLTMEQEGVLKVLDGQTTIEEIVRVTGEN